MTLGQTTQGTTHAITLREGTDGTQYVLGQRPKESSNGEPLGAGLQAIYTRVHADYARLSIRLCAVHICGHDIMVELRPC